MKKITFLLLFALWVFCANAQEKYKFKKQPDAALKKEIVKAVDSILFRFSPQLNFSFSTSHVYSYSMLPDSRVMQPDYLKSRLEALQQKLQDALLCNDIARYYQKTGDSIKAAENFRNAVKYLKIQKGIKDSAAYYSFRGVAKVNLGQEGVNDLKKALALNKTDSLAVAFYPVVLMGQQKFEEAKKIYLEALKANKSDYAGYVALYSCLFYEEIAKVGAMPEAEQKVLLKTDIDKIIDASAYDKYVDGKDKYIIRVKETGGIFGLIIKMMIKKVPFSDPAYHLEKEDVAAVARKEEYFKTLLREKGVNLYGVNFSLGMLNLMNRKYITAQQYFDDAAKAFPKEKATYEFNMAEVYDNLDLVLYLAKKYDRVVENLNKKLALPVLSAKDKKETLLNLARIYNEMGDNDAASNSAGLAADIEEDFETDLLLSQIHFKDGLSALADRYAQKASYKINTEEDFCNLITYYSQLYLLAGELDGARTDFAENKVKLKNEKCEQCEQFLSKYLILNKQ